MTKFIYISTFLLFSTFSFSQDAKVSLIGDEEKSYEAAMMACPTMLLEVADHSMEEAYALWTDMLSDMEKQAEEEGLDIKGVKIWMNLFWAADGSIDKIVYYPKPNSKNMDFDLISSFLEGFAANYVLPKTYNSCFSHYGSASFPVFTQVKNPNEK